jgi:hypothetical protein
MSSVVLPILSILLLSAIPFRVRGSAAIPDQSQKTRDLTTASFVTRNGSQLFLNGEPFRFSGPNMYWLGLDENVPPGTVAYPTLFRIEDGLRTAAGMGARVVRSHTLGISTGNPLSFEPALDQWNHGALHTIDYAVHCANKFGLKLVIPLTDNYHYFHGGKHDFTDWYGLPEADFYTNQTVIEAFKRYITELLNHTNQFSGIRYADDPAVLAWETGNELLPPSNWTQDIARHIKSISPKHLVLSGRFGVNPEELPFPEVDLYSQHYYPLNPINLVYEAGLTTNASKVFIAGEFGSTYNASFDAFVQTAESYTAVSGALYWSLFPHLDTYGFVQHNDGFTQHYPGEASNWRRNRSEALQALAWAISGKAAVPFHVVTAPLLHQIRNEASSGSTLLTWRGAAAACRYEVYRYTEMNPSNPIAVSTCVDDDELPFTDTGIPPSSAAGSWIAYFVVPISCDGTLGPESNHERFNLV